ncbi:secreted glycosyl hydrolase [Niveomyces insectorum RCEF 264]|uniref:Secreted glycosyl hydrolase n=1 Tax=Niveomyces insectorum RCEF 264 TaxID=1081102 RepID=A0A167Y0I4_9HYPO|nr:secreted glycosyl hydrolase [Niveomyces insectorum RCEF 264]
MGPAPFRVLVFSKTTAYRHASIPAGIAMFRRLAKASSSSSSQTVTTPAFDVDASEDAAAVFTPDNLTRYRVLVFLQTTGDFLDAAQLRALEAYVRRGQGGVVGIHAATVGMPSRTVDRDGFYGRLLGAVFTDHPPPQPGRVLLTAPQHPVVAPLLAKVASSTALKATGTEAADAAEADEAAPLFFSHVDEWYNYQPSSFAVAATKTAASTAAAAAAAANLEILLSADETSYTGGAHGPNHPIAWVWPDFDATGTRVFYTALGHYDALYADEAFVAHLRNALLWAAKAI